MKKQPFYKLVDPFRNIHYLPMSADKLSEQLDLSMRTAIRICTGEKQLKKSEVRYLQVLNFGLIPDSAFLRSKLYFYRGHIYCHDVKNFEMAAGQLGALYLWQTQYLRMEDQLKDAKARIVELELLLYPPKPEPTNIIQFSDFFTRE